MPRNHPPKAKEGEVRTVVVGVLVVMCAVCLLAGDKIWQAGIYEL